MSESAEPTPTQPSDAELAEALRDARVADLLAQTSSLLASLAFGKLAPDVRDLEQARLAIEALKALAPLLDEGPRRDIQHVVANLQLGYAAAVSGAEGASSTAGS